MPSHVWCQNRATNCLYIKEWTKLPQRSQLLTSKQTMDYFTCKLRASRQSSPRRLDLKKKKNTQASKQNEKNKYNREKIQPLK